MGKSTAAQMIQQLGVAVVDTDELARQVVQPGTPALQEILQIFGPKVLRADGQLHREELACIVFADAPARKRLEDILHPRIRDLWRAQVETWRGQGVPIAVVVIPLLFETGAESEFDSTICVACSAASQKNRLLARGWSASQIEQRLKAQWPTEQKIAAANFVVWNEGGTDVLSQQIERIIPPRR